MNEFKRFAISPAARAALVVLIPLIGANICSAQQAGDAYVLFNYQTGEFRMCPGHAVTGSNGIDSYGVAMNPAIGTISTNVNDYYFPSGSYFFGVETGANESNQFGAAFATYSLPNVTGGGDSLNAGNLVIGSAWAYPTSVPGSTAVYASTIPGYEGLPEFAFGTFGPTTLTESQALTALDASSQGAYATGAQTYTLKDLAGAQAFRIYTVPEPAGFGACSGGLALLLVGLGRRWRPRKRS